MFSSLTSYFWGSSEVEVPEPAGAETATGTTTCPVVPPSDRTSSPCQLRARPADQEEDWVLIDKTNSTPCGSPSLSRKSRLIDSDPCMDIDDSPSPRQPDVVDYSPAPSGGDVSPGAGRGDSSLSDSCSDVSTTAGTEESWLVTPPPCFTAGGANMGSMEENPMENLLIEHPSMSVYGPRGRQNSTGVDSVHSSSSEERDAAVVPTNQSAASLRNPPRRPRGPASARSNALALQRSVKASQRASVAKESRKMSRNHLQRSNRVTQYNTRGRYHGGNKSTCRIVQPTSAGRRC